MVLASLYAFQVPTYVERKLDFRKHNALAYTASKSKVGVHRKE